MKKIFNALWKVIISTALMVVFAIGLTACQDKTKLYKVTFSAGDGTGTAPTVEDKEKGEIFSLPKNTFVYEGYKFVGWESGGSTYAEDASFTMPGADVHFTATWNAEQPLPKNPAFSKTEYSYDRLGGGNLELPLDLSGYSFYHAEINGTRLASNCCYYNDAKSCLVIIESYMLGLTDGEYEIKAITDADGAPAPVCKINTDNSVKTSFDKETRKTFQSGFNDGVTFNVDFKGVDITRLTQNGIEVDKAYYALKDDKFTVKSDWLKKFCDDTSYEIELSNHDRYSFTIATNIIFYSDYDVTTIHDTTQSNVGVNSLYQYYDNVSIVSAPTGLDGKALKFTPNTEDVLYDCHGIYTLKADSWDSLWYAPGFIPGKVYAISFDYLTEGTSVGEFRYQSVNTSYKQDLLLGEKNDGVVHHFETFLTSQQIGNGLYLWAFFRGGSGSVYFDNFSITQLDALPELSSSQAYVAGDGDYTVEFAPNGMLWKIAYKGQEVSDVSFDAVNKTLTFPSAFMDSLEVGVNTIEIVTPIGNIKAELRVVGKAVAELLETEANYFYGRTDEIKLHGSFSDGVTITSLKMQPKSYNGGYDGWEFVYDDTSLDFSDKVTLVSGEAGKGYLRVTAEFLDGFYGDSVFVAEFSNGGQSTFTIHTDSVMLANSDESRIHGIWSGVRDFDTPLNSGWGNGAGGRADGEFSPRVEGDNAFFIRSTQNAGSCYAYTVKFHQHDWDWYRAPAKEGKLYRVTFDYQFRGLDGNNGQSYFMMMAAANENKERNFYGEGYTLHNFGDFDELRWNLTMDGEIHTFDSGWFTYSNDLRLCSIMLSRFAAENGRFAMLDNYRIIETDYFAVPDYTRGSGDYTFDLDGYAFGSMTIDGAAVDARMEGENVVVAGNSLQGLSKGAHSLKIVTANGAILQTVFSICDAESKAVLTKTRADFVYGDEKVILPGTFENVTLISAIKIGSHWFDRSYASPDNIETTLFPDMFEITPTELTIKKPLLDILYGRTEFALTFSNGAEVRFALTSNAIMYTDWDNTYVQQPNHPDTNHYTTQDSSALSVIQDGNGHSLKYYPHGGTGLASFALDNFFMLYIPAWAPKNIYTRLTTMTADKDYIVSFDYTVVGNNTDMVYYLGGYRLGGEMFRLKDISGAEGKFECRIGGGENMMMFGIGCATAGGAEGCYLKIDGYRITAVEKQQNSPTALVTTFSLNECLIATDKFRVSDNYNTRGKYEK